VPRARFQNLAQDDRELLLAIALRHFAEHGYDGASLNEILDEAGLSKGAYYYYFDDKEDLFATVLERELDRLIAAAPLPSFAGVTRASFWPLVERQVAHWADTWARSGPTVQVFAHVDEAMRKRPRFARLMEHGRMVFRPVIEAGRRVGCIRTDLPVDVLVQLVEAVDVVLDRVILARHPRTLTVITIGRHIELVLDTFRRLLAAPAPRRRRG
jgi:AcrR family transcriptional regulator